jgi:pimeloyl-ACP methyl ester carboxylesterase
MVEPYRIAVADALLHDLGDRLARTRWPDAIAGAGWDYGADLTFVRDLCEHWRTGYDWRAREASLNALPHFTAEVDGVRQHFWHVRGRGPDPLPLLLIHGWPGSPVEYMELIGPLTDPAAHGGDAADAFDVVVPDLPGFGFAGHPRERGWGLSRIAGAFDTLMSRELGYGRYGTHGGDWGSLISGRLGAEHAGHVCGVHLGMPYGDVPATAGAEERAAAAAQERGRFRERGYSAIQRTKPDVLTIAQMDSPAGACAWIVEKFRAWSDCDGDVESVFSRDVLLTNVMFYWATGSIASAARIYYEAFSEGMFAGGDVKVPTAVTAFPKEPFAAERDWMESRVNLVRWTDMPSGGHFGALERPGLVVNDLRAFFRELR